MDSLTPASAVAVPPAIPDQRPPRVWKFWGTTLWGLFIFAAMFLGQLAVIVYFVLRQGGSFDVAEAIRVVGGGLTISLSVILGLPAVLLATWVAIRPTRMSFADYLALRWTSWRNFFVGVAALAILVGGWDLLSRALGREVTPGFMGDVLKSAQADGALWLLVIAFCVAAPMWEEIFSRGFLYRGWSNYASASPAPSSCRRWPGPRCICSTTGSFSARCFRSACCSAISAIAPTRPG